MTFYDLKRPCKTCPFVIAHNFPLHPERIRAIADADPFTCHMTIDYGQDDPETGEVDPYRDTTGEQHCYGHLVVQWAEYRGFNKVTGFLASHGAFDPHALPTPEGAGCYPTFAAYAAAQGDDR